MSRTSWNKTDMPSQRGRVAVVTGPGGLGLEVGRGLAEAGAEVILAGRDAGRGEASVASIRATAPDAHVRFERLDLADLASVATFCERLWARRTSLDLLVNNAGVMTPPERRLTADGFELQLGTNHLGHFALTAGLLPLLRAAPGARVVSLGSVAARSGAIDFDDLNAERRYRPMVAYSQSKLACLLFAFELHRRSTGAGWGVESVAAHPGVARTDLISNSAGRWSASGMARRFLPFLFQPVAQGAVPILYAATAPEAQPGSYTGPDRLSETRGNPAPARVPPRAEDAETAARLWEISERMTGARFG